MITLWDSHGAEAPRNDIFFYQSVRNSITAFIELFVGDWFENAANVIEDELKIEE